MNISLQDRLLHALRACLRPLARVLLRSGVGYQQFAEVAKLAFVEEAIGEKDRRGRVKNTSRVAIRTGLSRKEVTKIRKHISAASRSDDEYLDAISRSGYAARVLQSWHSDPAYLCSDGRPRPLHASGHTGSFSSLVKLAGGDVPPGAVRAELLAAAAIVELADGRLAPVRRHYIPGDVGEDLVVGFTHVLVPVLEGLAHNTSAPKTDAFIQRVAYSDRLSEEAIQVFRHFTGAQASKFLQEMDNWLISNESTSSSRSQDTRVSIGVFCYVGPQVLDQGGQMGNAEEVPLTRAQQHEGIGNAN